MRLSSQLQSLIQMKQKSACDNLVADLRRLAHRLCGQVLVGLCSGRFHLSRRFPRGGQPDQHSARNQAGGNGNTFQDDRSKQTV